MNKPRLLIVDDDPVSCRILFESLSRLDFHVKVARTCAGAIEELAKDRTYDGIICDIMLPDSSGKDLLSRLRGEGSTIPFFFVSADDQMTESLTRQLGGQGFLRKPVHLEYLKSRVAAHFVRSK